MTHSPSHNHQDFQFTKCAMWGCAPKGVCCSVETMESTHTSHSMHSLAAELSEEEEDIIMSQIKESIKKNNQDEMETLLKSIKHTDRWQTTLIAEACSYGRTDILHKLIEYGASVRKAGEEQPLLHNAIHCGVSEIVQLFLKEGLSVDHIHWRSSDSSWSVEYTVLHTAVNSFHASTDILLMLLEAGAYRYVNHRSKAENIKPYHYTPLYLACKKGLVNFSKILLQYGANPHITTYAKETPLYVAYLHSHSEILELLFSLELQLGEERHWLWTIAAQGVMEAICAKTHRSVCVVNREKVSSLRGACRDVIRANLNEPFHELVFKLPLPETLIAYLQMLDI